MRNTQKASMAFQLWYALSFALQLGFMIVVPIGLFMAGGWWIDSILKFSSPFFLLTGAVVGCILTVYEVYHMLEPLIRKDQ